MFRCLDICFLVFVIGACSTTKIVEDPPALMPSGITTGEIEAAIRSAINSYNGSWLVEEANPGSIITGLHVRNHYMKVEITYSEHEISSHIISSVNLKQDKNSIHKKALYWQHRLILSINLELNKLSVPLGTGAKVAEPINLQTPGDIPAKLEQKAQDQPPPGKQGGTVSRTLEQQQGASKESAPQDTTETGMEARDKTDSIRSWKTYFEMQDERAQDIK